jgi:hypothetical protein
MIPKKLKYRFQFAAAAMWAAHNESFGDRVFAEVELNKFFDMLEEFTKQLPPPWIEVKHCGKRANKDRPARSSRPQA